MPEIGSATCGSRRTTCRDRNRVGPEAELAGLADVDVAGFPSLALPPGYLAGIPAARGARVSAVAEAIRPKLDLWCQTEKRARPVGEGRCAPADRPDRARWLWLWLWRSTRSYGRRAMNARRRVDLVDCPPPSAEEEWRYLLRVCAEALILTDEAEAVVLGVRARAPLANLARRGGPLVRRFFALRDELAGPCRGAEAEALRIDLGTILHSHAMAVATALDLAACEWRSPRLARQVDALTGLGDPARRLELIHHRLRSARLATRGAVPRDADRGAV